MIILHCNCKDTLLLLQARIRFPSFLFVKVLLILVDSVHPLPIKLFRKLQLDRLRAPNP